MISVEALRYMRERGLAGAMTDRLVAHPARSFPNEAAWLAHLGVLGMDTLNVTHGLTTGRGHGEALTPPGTQADRKLEAASVLATGPEAMQLRYMSTLKNIAGERNSAIVFPVPVDFRARRPCSFSSASPTGGPGPRSTLACPRRSGSAGP